MNNSKSNVKLRSFIYHKTGPSCCGNKSGPSCWGADDKLSDPWHGNIYKTRELCKKYTYFMLKYWVFLLPEVAVKWLPLGFKESILFEFYWFTFAKYCFVLFFIFLLSVSILICVIYTVQHCTKLIKSIRIVAMSNIKSTSSFRSSIRHEA